MESNDNILKRITELSRTGVEFAVVTIIEAGPGSLLQSGTKMIVFPSSETEYSIGGGELEKITIKKAQEALEKGENTQLDLDFEKENSITVFIEVFAKSEKVFIFGAGHIALALSKYLDILNITYIIVDDRENMLTEARFPNAEYLVHNAFDSIDTDLGIDKNSYCVIVTHGHIGDFNVMKRLLETESPYLGMIGSKNKVKTILKKLIAEGLSPDDRRIFSPIGLDIGGESPEEIGISIIAEILKIKYDRSGLSYKERAIA